MRFSVLLVIFSFFVSATRALALGSDKFAHTGVAMSGHYALTRLFEGSNDPNQVHGLTHAQALILSAVTVTVLGGIKELIDKKAEAGDILANTVGIAASFSLQLSFDL